MNKIPVLASDRKKTTWNAAVPAHPNERVELAHQILGLRQRLRRVQWDFEQAKKVRSEIERLEQKLREIDE